MRGCFTHTQMIDVKIKAVLTGKSNEEVKDCRLLIWFEFWRT